MRRSAFTLIEMLISLAIVIVVLGASISANRSILGNTQITSDHIQMTAILEDAQTNLQLLQRQLQSAGASLGDVNLGFNLPDSQTTASQRVLPYGDATLNPSDPVTMHWCTISNNSCKDQLSSIGTNGRTIKISDMLDPNRLDPGGELIAVRHTPSSDTRQMVSMVSRLQSDNGTFLSATDPTTQANWDFYVRTITATRLGRTAPSPYMQAITGNPADALAKTFTVTITVRKYLVSSTPPVSRTVILTDN